MLSIIGAGRLGSTTAALLAQQGVPEITLLDIMPKFVDGQSKDLGEGFPNTEFTATTNYKDLKGSKVVLVTAGLARKPGMTRPGLVDANKKIIDSIMPKLEKHVPNAVLLFTTNPVDILLHHVTQKYNFPSKRVLGFGSLLDTRRFEYFIAQELNTPMRNVRALVMGEHGDSMVPIWSRVRVKGKVKKFSPDQKKRITRTFRDAGAYVIARTGATIFGPCPSIATELVSIMNNQRRVLPVSTFLRGEYGVEDVCLAVPTVLGKRGAEQIKEYKLSESEQKAFEKSASAVKELAVGL